MSAINVEGFVAQALCQAAGVEHLPTPAGGYTVPRAIANAGGYAFGDLSVSAKASLVTAIGIFVAHGKLDDSFNVRAKSIETAADAQALVQDADEAMVGK
ncbi:hypothetical protein GOB83_14425 [Acetobacter fabarum]|uniref:hypothetical protein n=1 Tax=Acetobacter fabarum TaxID=483199 RepID=UPI00140541E1|nr:hypothetical protein [Acetobacter fabarum]NHO43336.1 hypothetical protein [Acetobacter fabarum]GBQ33045.1 hypothetical protein AA19596_1068 [Acetobacter fabarum DSM 19596]